MKSLQRGVYTLRRSKLVAYGESELRRVMGGQDIAGSFGGYPYYPPYGYGYPCYPPYPYYPCPYYPYSYGPLYGGYGGYGGGLGY